MSSDLLFSNMAVLKSMQNNHSEIEILSSTSQQNQGNQSVEHILTEYPCKILCELLVIAMHCT